MKLPEKIKISRKFSWNNRHFVDLDPRPQISNQIDAATIIIYVCNVAKHVNSAPSIYTQMRSELPDMNLNVSTKDIIQQLGKQCSVGGHP